jgi:hypothetical protein
MSNTLGNHVTVHLACDSNGGGGKTNWTARNSVTGAELFLAACGLFAAVVASETKAATVLPGITVTGYPTPPGDIVRTATSGRPILIGLRPCLSNGQRYLRIT